MPKRNKRKHKQTAPEYEMTEVRGYGPEPYGKQEETMTEKLPEETPANPPPLAHDRPAPNPTTLASLREDALRARRNVTEQIASLESWAAEIQATIEFLKASKR